MSQIETVKIWLEGADDAKVSYEKKYSCPKSPKICQFG